MNIVAPEHTAFCRKDRLEVAVRSLRSPTDHGRRENQDNYLVVDGQGRGRFLREQQEAQVQLADWPSGHWRIAVLDGMGGHSRCV